MSVIAKALCFGFWKVLVQVWVLYWYLFHRTGNFQEVYAASLGSFFCKYGIVAHQSRLSSG